MKRRALLVGTGMTLATVSGGCLNRLPGGSFDINFEQIETDMDAESPPEITVEGETILVEGTVAYGSTDCADLELAHAEYQRSQERLDLLIAGVDDGAGGSCNDAAVSQGYRVEATRSGGFRYVPRQNITLEARYIQQHLKSNETTYSRKILLDTYDNGSVGILFFRHILA